MLRSDAIDLARRHRAHRELYVGTSLGPVMVEGYVDLLLATSAGLIVVDYKPDTVATQAQLDAKVASYGLQAATYAVALEQVTGLEVIECRFVFSRRGDSVEASVSDLASVKQQVIDTVTGLAGAAAG